MTRLVWNAPQLCHVVISVALRMVHSKPVLHTLLMLELGYTHTQTTDFSNENICTTFPP